MGIFFHILIVSFSTVAFLSPAQGANLDKQFKVQLGRDWDRIPVELKRYTVYKNKKTQEKLILQVLNVSGENFGKKFLKSKLQVSRSRKQFLRAFSVFDYRIEKVTYHKTIAGLPKKYFHVISSFKNSRRSPAQLAERFYTADSKVFVVTLVSPGNLPLKDAYFKRVFDGVKPGIRQRGVATDLIESLRGSEVTKSCQSCGPIVSSYSIYPRKTLPALTPRELQRCRKAGVPENLLRKEPDEYLDDRNGNTLKACTHESMEVLRSFYDDAEVVDGLLLQGLKNIDKTPEFLVAVGSSAAASISGVELNWDMFKEIFKLGPIVKLETKISGAIKTAFQRRGCYNFKVQLQNHCSLTGTAVASIFPGKIAKEGLNALTEKIVWKMANPKPAPNSLRLPPKGIFGPDHRAFMNTKIPRDELPSAFHPDAPEAEDYLDAYRKAMERARKRYEAEMRTRVPNKAIADEIVSKFYYVEFDLKQNLSLAPKDWKLPELPKGADVQTIKDFANIVHESTINLAMKNNTFRRAAIKIGWVDAQWFLGL